MKDDSLLKLTLMQIWSIAAAVAVIMTAGLIGRILTGNDWMGLLPMVLMPIPGLLGFGILCGAIRIKN
jgi:O-antigen/teichoic acid export membrane protein